MHVGFLKIPFVLHGSLSAELCALEHVHVCVVCGLVDVCMGVDMCVCISECLLLSYSVT